MTHHRAEAVAFYKKAIAYEPQADGAVQSRKYLETPYNPQ
jgi:hypothetical protein